MVDKASVGEKNEEVRNDLVMKQTNNVFCKWAQGHEYA